MYFCYSELLRSRRNFLRQAEADERGYHQNMLDVAVKMIMSCAAQPDVSGPQLKLATQ